MELLQEYWEEKGGYDKIKDSFHLDSVESKSDPVTEPYRSKYKARKIWEEVKEDIQARLTGEARLPGQQDAIYRCTIATLNYYIGVNCAETDELQDGDEHLRMILDSIGDLKLNALGYSLYTKTLNHRGFICSTLGKHEDALQTLMESKKLYDEYKHVMEAGPWRITEFVTKCDQNENESERLAELESVYTHTLYYIAQVYGNLGKKEDSAHYCNVTLKRQLESSKYDAKDWALNAAALSQFFISQNDFFMARHCLASASVIFGEFLDKHDENLDEDEDDGIMMDKANIERCWIKYGLSLLESSQDKLVEDVENMDNVSNSRVARLIDQMAYGTAGSESADASNSDDKKSFLFDLELTQHEENITCKYLLDFSDARRVFLVIQQWIKSSQDYFTINEHCSDYIEITQDHSRAFKLLSFFEVNIERRCRMEKRRIDMLSSLLNELNPQFYLQVCRQLMFEIAETYSSMMELKLAILDEGASPPTAHVFTKINHLAKCSIEQYTAYLDTLKGGKPEWPDQFPDTDVRPGLVAMFCIGRLYGKLLTSDNSEKINNVENSLASYRFLVEYCMRNPSAVELVSTELNICKEMVTLLPLKVQKLMSSSPDF